MRRSSVHFCLAFASIVALLSLRSSNCEVTFSESPIQALNFVNAIQEIGARAKFAETHSQLSTLASFDENAFSARDFVTDTLGKFVAQMNDGAPANNGTGQNVTEQCLQQLEALQVAILSRQEWAINVLDAFGKPTSGIKQGSLSWLGEYAECINITQPDWTGKYCLISKPFAMGAGDGPSFSIKYGTCLPKVCNRDDISTIINFAIKNITAYIPFKLNISYIDSTYVVCQEEKSVDGTSVFVIVIISVLVLLSIIASLMDIYKEIRKSSSLKFNTPILIIENEIPQPETTVKHRRRPSININDQEELIPVEKKDETSKILRILQSFSLYANTKKLFNVKQNDSQLVCLHAIRFFSIAWVILGHTYIFSVATADNTLVLFEWLKEWPFLLIENAQFSVDTFFLLSGMLTTYVFMKEITKTKKISFGLMFKYYIHRFWRLTPPYMLVLMISACLSKYMGAGPLFPPNGFEINYCRDTWWTNFLYVNNLINVKNMCLNVTWYLANDMQFHWIAPLMILPLAFGEILENRFHANVCKIVGFFMCALFLLTNIITMALIVNTYPSLDMQMMSAPDFFERVYVTPWCRIGPFVVGILLGYLIHWNKSKYNYKLRLELNIIGWMLTFLLMGLLLFGLYPDNIGHPLGRVEHILYHSLSRPLWGVAVSFLIFACLTNNGGFINKLLSLPLWTPLSRLSFSAYLIHSTIIYAFHYNQDHTYHYQSSGIAYTFAAHLGFSFVAAYFVSMVFEVPLLGLEKFIFKH